MVGPAMKSLIETYERYLERAGKVPPNQRTRIVYKVVSPWILAAAACAVVVNFLALPRNIAVWLLAPMALLSAAGAIYAARRVALYGWQFDRTPSDRALTAMPGGDALVQALRRVTLNRLSDLTLSTRLQADLRLTPADMSALLDILAAEHWLEVPSLEGLRTGDLTVGALLKTMSPT